MNNSVRDFEKISKYKKLGMVIERMWHLKTEIVYHVVGKSAKSLLHDISTNSRKVA